MGRFGFFVLKYGNQDKGTGVWVVAGRQSPSPVILDAMASFIKHGCILSGCDGL